ncbi:hypothetical protein NP493_212g01019 [Ridgeia piscesae]|uniref:Mesencephalic astrocyte-derived neurotrophic factor homolog n=1 Tax=Ridgeia piscesae TaxID=27915 RepID=A0AAD9P0X8_RIDPI|nr:hypothetical protein NP493_212g01019 [Ridgeia piscesae]
MARHIVQELNLQIVIAVLTICCVIFLAEGKKLKSANEENCEVCVKYIGKFIDSLDSDTKGDQKKVEKAFMKFCKNSKKGNNRLCYYIGGLEESATSIVAELAKPISWGMPSDKICYKLYIKDQQICDLKYEKTVDLATVNLKKLKVKELKNILSDWDEQCRGCTEKSDYIKLIDELMPKYAPEAAEKRKRQEL